MVLVYIDESGINYKHNLKYPEYFSDGPYAIWAGVFVSDSKYFHIERGFHELAKKYFPKKITEFHATEIWEKAKTNKKQNEKVKRYFEELFQLIAKLHLNVVVGIQQKNPTYIKNHKTDKDKELEKARYSFLHLVEHNLALMNETGVLVADSESEETGATGDNESRLEREKMKNLVQERINWRVGKGTLPLSFTPKFEFEYRSNFIIDQLHYVRSNESLPIQFVDHICFVIRRGLECVYLAKFPGNNRPKADPNLVPVTESTFNFFLQSSNVSFGYHSKDDVTFSDLTGFKQRMMFQSQSIAGFVSPELFIFDPTGFTPYK